ncbi:DUF5916 domain-containing protein [Luteimonas sp. RD2P54]|uniref:DUF5916 domain-containing protein n=1 Tax=Luteimonas endophytica TaxID=3042023 RepID=A0ABT6JB36_9GAMM|nr:DUF5916 domain-containing protein [Luteimonas endophytica]MDH5824035.1 DUF5916 domain-containing protein [Luteimonas endophytica]
MPCARLAAVFLSLAGAALPAGAVEIDGRVAPGEWEGAHRVTDFRKVQPLNGEPASHPTEAWVLAVPDGLAVAFRNVQPAGVPRSRERLPRDFQAQVDRVNLMVDFDGGGRTGYNFTVSATGDVYDAVITAGGGFNSDWDGSWRSAVTEHAEGWEVEMLVPWHVAPMRGGEGETRTLHVYLDRVIGASGERVAWPEASFERPRFLTEFAPVEVPRFSQSLLAITPYSSLVYDNVAGRGDLEAGADLFWKPSGQFQLTATVNPDFGQVESDDLVVNFSATETFFSDKRPFFTENQGLFDFATPSDDSQLLYTRRVGGPADDGSGAGDITAALKLNGNAGTSRYGLFLADESGAVGRTFGALRLTHDLERQNLGLMLTRVERPFLDRQATVLGVDQDWRPTASLSVRTRLLGSRIDQDGATTRGGGITSYADYEMHGGWRQQWMAMHFSDELQINDFGYLSRNDLNYAHWQVSRRLASLPAASRYSAHDWRARVSTTRNDGGERLYDQLRIIRSSRLRDGSEEYAQINVNGAGVDDLLTRGHGSLRLPPRATAYYEYSRPRRGAWAHEVEVEVFGGGLSGNRRLGHFLSYAPTLHVNDRLNLVAGLAIERMPDWLVWQRENLVGSFSERSLELEAGVNWTLAERQELRVKLQALALDARLRQAYRVEGGRALASEDPVDDFAVRTLGFQVRYRYEIAPLSYLYVVYARGGYEQLPHAEDVGGLLGDAFRLRDDEQLLVKFSYRFAR